MTNYDKFTEVFGFEPDITTCGPYIYQSDKCCSGSCDDCDYYKYDTMLNADACHCEEWWDEEYIDPSTIVSKINYNKESIMNIKIKKLNENATLPTRGSEYAAGYDLYSASSEQLWIFPSDTKLISTGISVEIPEGYFGAIYARSGIASKRGLRPANCVGVIDSDYRGEIMVAIHNDTNVKQFIKPKERIAQLIIQPYLSVDFEEVDELSDTERGEGGFGSTGTN